MAVFQQPVPELDSKIIEGTITKINNKPIAWTEVDAMLGPNY